MPTPDDAETWAAAGEIDVEVPADVYGWWLAATLPTFPPALQARARTTRAELEDLLTPEALGRLDEAEAAAERRILGLDGG